MDNLSSLIGKLKTDNVLKMQEYAIKHVKQVWVKINSETIPNWEVKDKEVNNQIVYYLARSEKFNGDLNKGILLVGNTGSGKTRMLNSLSIAMGYLHGFRFIIKSGIELEKAFRKNEEFEGLLNQKMFAFDDWGEEHEKIKVWGTEINVGVEVISNRYNLMMKNGSLTFGTTNLTDSMILDKYGSRIDSRKNEMFNVIPLVGNDLRKEKI